ncbi:MAG: hypothetical protein ACJ76N_22165 [Thermoanaerobaculia bacterium]
MKKALIKLSLLSALVAAAFLSSPTQSVAQTSIQACPDGTFQCTCNGISSCQSSIADCWNSC